MILSKKIPLNFSGLDTAVYTANELDYFLSICGEHRRFNMDIEVYAELFCAVFTDHDTNNTIVFEVTHRRNDLIKFVNFYTKCVKWNITFNGNNYDNLVCNWICDPENLALFYNGRFYNTLSYIHECIYKVSQVCLNREKDPYTFDAVFTKEKWQLKYRFPFYSIDVFLFWSQGIRKQMKLSLKSSAFMLNENVMETPVRFDKLNLTSNEIHSIIYYCVNDTLVLKKMAQKLSLEINLRLTLYQKYDLDCLSWDIPKISRNLLVKKYVESTFDFRETEAWQNYWCRTPITENNQAKFNSAWHRAFKKELKSFKEKRKGRHKQDWSMKDILPKFDFKIPEFQKLYSSLLHSGQSFSHYDTVKNSDGTVIRISWGVGGIHAVNDNEYYEQTPNWLLIDSDATSLYPNWAIQNLCMPLDLHPVFMSFYSETKTLRVLAKRRGDKVEDLFFKLFLNAYSGVLDQDTSELYEPSQAMKMRIGGQLLLTKCMEECILRGWVVFSCNTDGLTVKVPPHQLHEYFQVIKNVGDTYGITFEHVEYSKIAFLNVNSYFAIKTAEYDVETWERKEKFEVKKKGDFETSRTFEKSNEMRVIAKAVEAYYAKGIPVAQFIRNHRDIYDFCGAKKISKDYEVIFMNEKVQQLNRYFVSKNGSYLYKKKNSKGKIENVMKGTRVTIMNQKFEDLDISFDKCEVNYDWYISQTYDFIRMLEEKKPSNLLQLW